MMSETAFIGCMCFSFVGGAIFAVLAFKMDLYNEAYWREWERRRADGLELRLKQLAEKLKKCGGMRFRRRKK